MEKANEFITDLAISKFSSHLAASSAIESEEDLNKELQKHELLKRDVDQYTPYIPAFGILSDGITAGKHIFNHIGRKVSKDADAQTDSAQEKRQAKH